MKTLKVLQELKEEIELYCDPNERVTKMINRFIEIESKLNKESENDKT